jgi:Rrf2 family protein
MLKLSKKGEYGIEVLIILSQVKDGELMSIRSMSEERKLPLYFLSQIMSDLKKAGYVESKEGIGGGYKLIKEPSKISLLDVLTILEGEPCIVNCADKKNSNCKREKVCSAQKGLKILSESLNNFFRDKTLQDLIGEIN